VDLDVIIVKKYLTKDLLYMDVVNVILIVVGNVYNYKMEMEKK